MPTPQPGIFALGTMAHAYLEFDVLAHADPAALLAAAASVSEPRTTMGGVNLVTGFRPELWAAVHPAKAPAEVTGFTVPVVGSEGFTMPATQHDAVHWVAGASYDVVFDVCIALIDAMRDVAAPAAETVGWSYHHDLDLTGFIDGTENPSVAEAAASVTIANDSPGAGGSVLLLQKWRHDAAAWNALPKVDQEAAIGRTKIDSIELEDAPTSAHVTRTDQDKYGHIFRRNTPYGTVLDHGTMFVGFAAARSPLHRMLESMAGTTGDRDALTRYSQPLSGAYYFVPALEDLAAWEGGV